MSEQTTKLTTRQQLERTKAELEQKIADAERELEFSNRKVKESDEKLAIAKKEYESVLTRSLDINKVSFEAMKHLTTLSAGSIVLMVTFLERLFNTDRKWIGLIGLALISFVASIVCAMSSMTKWQGNEGPFSFGTLCGPVPTVIYSAPLFIEQFVKRRQLRRMSWSLPPVYSVLTLLGLAFRGSECKE